MSYLLLQAVVVPIAAAFLCYLLSAKLGNKVGWVAFGSVALSALALILFGAPQLFTLSVASITESYTWAPTAGLGFGFLADGLSFPVLILMDLVLAAS